ncbi:MAG: respiratory chain complex I subunit 1 family protein [Rectinemataceae bacterium]
MIDTIIRFAFLILVPPLMLGLINRVKSVFAGRKGPPLLQSWRDIVKLAGKGIVLSSTTSWVFIAGPAVTLAAILVSGCLVPYGPFRSPFGFAGDLVLFAYLFGLARFFTTSAALDTGSAFEGMGASREVTFAILSEPAFFLSLLALARLSGALDLNGLLLGPEGGFSTATAAPLVLVGLALGIVLLAETSRIPVDDPNTHLELTMIHEVMVLDHSGPLLGAVLYSAALRLFVLSSVLLHVVMPFRIGVAALDWILFAAGLAGISIVIGVIESVMARFRMGRVPWFLTGALLCAGSAFVLLVR